MSENSKNRRIMKTDNKYNPYAFDVWVTTRKYVSAFAVMHAIIALKRKGWTIDVGSPTTNHFIVAYKPVSEINEC